MMYLGTLLLVFAVLLTSARQLPVSSTTLVSMTTTEQHNGFDNITKGGNNVTKNSNRLSARAEAFIFGTFVKVVSGTIKSAGRAVVSAGRAVVSAGRAVFRAGRSWWRVTPNFFTKKNQKWLSTGSKKSKLSAKEKVDVKVSDTAVESTGSKKGKVDLKRSDDAVDSADTIQDFVSPGVVFTKCETLLFICVIIVMGISQ